MKRIVAFLIGMFFAISSIALAFHINLGRDPFMDLIKLQQMRQKKQLLKVKKSENDIEKEVEMLLSSLKVTMVVSSKTNPNLKAALIVGPSGIPLVVVEGQKIKKGVYVEDITSDGVKLLVESGGKKKEVELKLAQ